MGEAALCANEANNVAIIPTMSKHAKTFWKAEAETGGFECNSLYLSH